MRSLTRRHIACGLGAVILSLEASARADDVPVAAVETDPKVPLDAAARADALILEGVELRIAGREGEALERFRRAYEIEPSARAMGQMGLAEKSMRLYVDAANHLDAALAAEDDPWVDQNREALLLARDIVGKQVANLLVRSNVEDAELWVNGVMVTRLPLSEPLRTLAGAARVEVRAPGYATRGHYATLAAGDLTEIDLALSPEAVVAAPPVVPNPASEQAPPPSADTQSEPVNLTPWIYGSLGVGGVAIGLGTYFGIRAFDKKDERDAVCPDADRCPTEQGVELDADARAAANWSTATMAVGGVALTAALVLWIVEMAGEDTTAPSVLVIPAPGGAWIGGALAF